MERIAGLHAEIVPQREYATRQWFYASPLWYYHRPGLNRCIHASSRFFDLLDPGLRELCGLLIDSGLRTTPSCQGHFYPREYFQRVWGVLQEEFARIVGGGLEVRDSETEEQYLFADASYSLPWPGFEAFHAAVAGQQHRGYLGILVPLHRTECLETFRQRPLRSDTVRLEEDFELALQLGQPVFNVFVEAGSPARNQEAWEQVANYMMAALGRVRAEDPMAA